jgi:hypothetical protein
MSPVLHVLVLCIVASRCTATTDALLALQTHFHAGCLYLLQSHNTAGETNIITVIRLACESSKFTGMNLPCVEQKNTILQHYVCKSR